MAIVDASQTGDLFIGRGASRTVEVVYRVGDTSYGGTVSAVGLSVTDRDQPTYQSAESHAVTTAIEDAAPVVAPQAFTVNVDPASIHGGVLRVENPTNVNRTYTLTLGGEGVVVEATTGFPNPFVVAALGVVELPLSYEIVGNALAGATGRVTYAVSEGGHSVAGGVELTTNEVLVAPVMGAMEDPLPLEVGSVREMEALLTNLSNAPRRFVFAGTSSDPAVAVVMEVSAAGEIPAFGSRVLRIAYRIPEDAPDGGESVLTLEAGDQLLPELRASGSFQVTARQWTCDDETARNYGEIGECEYDDPLVCTVEVTPIGEQMDAWGRHYRVEAVTDPELLGVRLYAWDAMVYDWKAEVGRNHGLLSGAPVGTDQRPARQYVSNRVGTGHGNPTVVPMNYDEYAPSGVAMSVLLPTVAETLPWSYTYQMSFEAEAPDNPLIEVQIDCDRVPVTCDDPNALNYGEAGECEYEDGRCWDPNASNYGEVGDCSYANPVAKLAYHDGGTYPHIQLSWTEFTGAASIASDGGWIVSYEWVYSGYMEQLEAGPEPVWRVWWDNGCRDGMYQMDSWAQSGPVTMTVLDSNGLRSAATLEWTHAICSAGFPGPGNREDWRIE